jgi:DNA-binding NarL/FixJ family response regulator
MKEQPAMFLDAIKTVANGGQYLHPEIALRIAFLHVDQSPDVNRRYSLTPSTNRINGTAQIERPRLIDDEENTSQRVREIAYRLWQEEGCPEGEALRHWFAAKTLFERDKGPQ